jgi:hypothetical protein
LSGFEEQMSRFPRRQKVPMEKRGPFKCLPNLPVSSSLVATLATRAENGGLHRVMRARRKMPSFALRKQHWRRALKMAVCIG